MMKYEDDNCWHVYYMDEDDVEVVWCQSVASDAVRPGEHAWIMYENGREHTMNWTTYAL